MRGIKGAAVVAALFALTGCGGGPSADCISLDRDAAQAVQDGADGDLAVGQGKAVRADSGVYYAAFTINAAGSDEVGVWAFDNLPPTSIRAVDGYAQQFTVWPTLEGANASPDARAAEACLDQ